MPCNMTLGKNARGGAEKAMLQLRRIFRGATKAGRRKRVISVAETMESGAPRTHQMVTVVVGGIEIRALFDSGAVSNIMSEDLVGRLGLYMYPDNGDVSVVNGQNIGSEGR